MSKKNLAPIFHLTENKHVPPSPIGYFTAEQLREYVTSNYPLDRDDIEKWLNGVIKLDCDGRAETIYIRADWTLEAIRMSNKNEPLLPLITDLLTTDPCPVYDSDLPEWVIKDTSTIYSSYGDAAHHMLSIADKILIRYDTITKNTARGKLYMPFGYDSVMTFDYTHVKNASKQIQGNIGKYINVNDRGSITDIGRLLEYARILKNCDIKGLNIKIF